MSGSRDCDCDWRWNKDDNRDGLSVTVDKNTLPELSLSLSPTHNDTCHVMYTRSILRMVLWVLQHPGPQLRGFEKDCLHASYET